MVVIGLATIPMTVLAATLITQQIQARKAQLELDLARSASAFALTIEREVASSVDALYILSLSEPLQHGDIAGIFASMSTLPEPRKSWSSTFLVDLDGDVLFNTHQPLGRPLGKLSDMAALQRLLHTRQAAVTDLIIGPDGQFTTGVMVPVLVNGKITGVLGAWIRPSNWRDLILTSGPSRSGFMTIFDAHTHVVASSLNHKDVVSQPLPVLTQARIRQQGEGVAPVGMFSGGQAYGAWHLVSATGWGVVIGETARPIDLAHALSIASTFGMGLLSLGVGMLLAMKVARRVTEPLDGLIENGPHIPARPSSVQELRRLELALSEAEMQREAALERLQAKADEFETLFQCSPIGLAITKTSDCERVLRNPALARMLNEPTSEQAPLPAGRTEWPSHQIQRSGRVLPAHEQPLQRAAMTGRAQMDVELDVVHADGSVLKMIAHAVPLLDAQKGARGAIAAFTDITELKQAEALLSSAEVRLRESLHLMALAQTAGDVGFFNHDFTRDVVTWSSGLSRLFGMALSDFEGSWEDWMRRLGQADRPLVRLGIEEAVAAGDSQRTFEFHTVGDDGSVRWLSTKVMIAYDAHGNPLHMHGAVVDITQQKSFDQERAAWVERATHARQEAERTNRDKDEFLAMLGHELRNPLGAMASACEVLNHAQTQEDMALRARQILTRQTSHLARLMDDLLDMARVISGKILLIKEPMRLDLLAQRILHTFEVTGQLSEHQIDTNFEEVMVHADMTRLEQVITNLLKNALTYTPEQGRISMVVGNSGHQAFLQLQDSGIGMAPEMMSRAFNLFAQGARSLDRRQGGLGMGLTLVKYLIELHGGRVSVSSPGLQKGCTFTLCLPVLDEAAASEVDVVPASVVVAQCKVVVVEDIDDARESLCAMLALGQHEILSATDGMQGLNLIAQTNPDLALIDIGLPELTGYQVARQLREQGYEGWLVAVSGYGLSDDLARSHEAGFDDHIVKPLNPEKLDQVLSRASCPRPAGKQADHM